MSYLALRNYTIIFLFTLSIFFSHVVIYSFQFRFFYLFSIFFLFFDFITKKSIINKKIILLSIITLILIVIHSHIGLIKYANLEYNNFFITFIKSLFISLSMILIYYYKDLILKNITSCINIFLTIFFFYSIYILISNDYFYNFNLINCSNLFRFDKLVFKELSHFHLLSVPIILYSIINFNEIRQKKITMFLISLFFIFSFLNFSLTFFIGIIGGSVIISIVSKNLTKKIIIFLLIINFVNIGIFFSQKDTCAAKRLIDPNTYKYVLSPKEKLLTTGIFSVDSATVNYSFKVYINSFQVAIHSFKNSIAGYGFDNYKLAFDAYIPKSYDKEKKTYPYRDLNSSDASNNFSKLTSEFGIFFLIICIIVILKSRTKNLDDKQKALIYTLLFMQIFIRGSGIFNNGFLIISIILMYSLFSKKKIN